MHLKNRYLKRMYKKSHKNKKTRKNKPYKKKVKYYISQVSIAFIK